MALLHYFIPQTHIQHHAKTIILKTINKKHAADTVNGRAPHNCLDMCYVNSSLFVERIFPQIVGTV